MSSAAVLWNHVSIDWVGVFAAMGVLAGCLAACALQLAKGRSMKAMGLVLPAAIVFSLVLGRLCHWYCHPLQYADLVSAMTDFSTGGLALPGAFAGTLLAAVLVRLAGFSEDLGGLLDVLAPAGALAIAVGRLGSAFDTSCRGSFLPEAVWLQQWPFAAPSTTAAGAVEWRFATFAWQAGVCFALFFLCFLLVLAWKRPQNGHVFALFLSLYAAAELVLDSTRYDAGYIRANGFVSLTQLCCITLLVLVCVVYSVARVRERGLGRRLWIRWGVFLALGGLGGYMEYFVQRHGNRFDVAYPVMAGCFLLMALINLRLSREKPRVSVQPTEPPQS